jgi:hypothetical protein
MKINIIFLRILLAVVFISPIGIVFAEDSNIAIENHEFMVKYETVKRLDLIDYDFVFAIKSEYDKLTWSKSLPDKLDVLSEIEISSMFSILNIATHQTNEVNIVRNFVSLYYERERRGQLSASDSEIVLRQLLAARLFDEAIAFKLRHSGLSLEVPSVSGIRQTSLPSVLDVPSSGLKLVRKEFSLPRGGFIIAVGSPLCHFSENAINFMSNDQQIRESVAGKIQWVVPQDRSNDALAVRSWNQTHKAASFSMVYRSDEWSQIRSWETPTFYFFHDGLLVDSFAGWPREGRANLLKEKLRAIGLLKY